MKRIKNIRPSIFIVSVLLISCSEQQVKIEGRFQNINDGSETLIKKLDKDEYEISAVFNPQLHFKVIRNGNKLNGSFQGMPIVVEFNRSYDTITNKTSSKEIFIAKRIK